MSEYLIQTIDGIDYYPTKKCTLWGKVYQEYKSTDVTNPDIVYLDEDENIVGGDTLYAIRIKYAMCVLALHGELIMDYTLNLDDDEFVIENGKLVILNEKKRAIFDKHINKKGWLKNFFRCWKH